MPQCTNRRDAKGRRRFPAVALANRCVQSAADFLLGRRWPAFVTPFARRRFTSHGQRGVGLRAHVEPALGLVFICWRNKLLKSLICFLVARARARANAPSNVAQSTPIPTATTHLLFKVLFHRLTGQARARMKRAVTKSRKRGRERTDRQQGHCASMIRQAKRKHASGPRQIGQQSKESARFNDPPPRPPARLMPACARGNLTRPPRTAGAEDWHRLAAR